MTQKSEKHGSRPAATTGISLLLAALTALLLAGCGAKDDGPRPGVEYAALGDSYAAAPRLEPQTTQWTPGVCGQSAANYPHRLAQRLRPRSFSDRSCTSAKLADLYRPQAVPGIDNAAQGLDLGPRTKLVTLTIGANDIALTQLLANCLGQADASRPCDAVTIARRSAGTFEQSFRDLEERLPKAFSDIQRRSPQALIVAIGYPQIVPSHADQRCARQTHITVDGMAFVDRQIQRLNDIMRATARAAGQRYVDTYGPSSGHDACAPPQTRWVEPVEALQHADPFHSNPRGQAAFARLALRVIPADAARGSTAAGG